jgi:RNA polymerase sigma-70 factor, ECF subfamily
MGLRSATSPFSIEASTHAAFGTLFDRDFSYVWGTLRRLGIHERDLEDVTHEVFLQVYRHWAAFDASRAARPWLFGFAFRLAADYRRLARHRAKLVGDAADLECAAQSAPPADDQVVTREAVELVHAALDRLDFDQRAVFILHDIDGCPMKEVADALTIRINTGYSRLRLARVRFASAVRKVMAQRGEPR